MSSRPDCIFEIHQLWQSRFSRVYSNGCCSCWFEPEIIKISQSPHKIYSGNIVNFQESTTILNAHTKKPGSISNAPRIYICIFCLASFSLSHPLSQYIYIYIADWIYLSFLHLTFSFSLSLCTTFFMYIYI